MGESSFASFYNPNNQGGLGGDFWGQDSSNIFTGLNTQSPDFFSMPGAVGAGSNIPANGGWMDSLKNSKFGQNVSSAWDWAGDNKEEIQGVGAGLMTLFKMYSGWKSMGMAQDQFDFYKKKENRAFGAGQKDYENQLRDRWSARNIVEQDKNAQGRGTGWDVSEDTYVKNRAIPG